MDQKERKGETQRGFITSQQIWILPLTESWCKVREQRVAEATKNSLAAVPSCDETEYRDRELRKEIERGD